MEVVALFGSLISRNFYYTNVFFMMILFLHGCTEKSKEKEQLKSSQGLSIWSLPETTVNTAQLIIAEVNGEKIYSDQVKSKMKIENIDAKVALNKLIDEILVFQSAIKSSNPKEISELYKAQAVYNIIEKEFEKNNTPEKISEEALRSVFDEIQGNRMSRRFSGIKFMFGHSQWRLASQLIIQKKEMRTKDMRVSAISMMRLLKSWMELEKVDSEKSFQQGAWIPYRSAYLVRFENKIPSLAKGFNENFYRIGRSFDKQFKEELFKIKGENQFSDLFFSQYGLHFIFLKKIFPAVSLKFDDIKSQLRIKLGLSYRTEQFEKWLKELRLKHKAKLLI
jgi:hypothetical protein